MAANKPGATLPIDYRGVASGAFKQHLEFTTLNDDKQVRINSRPYNQATGGSIAFQSKPSQETTTTGDVIGGEISPRVQSGIAFGQIKGLHVDCDLKAAAGGNGANVRALELELVSPAGSTRTISGDVVFIRFRSGMEAGITITGDHSVLEVEASEGTAWGMFAKFPSDSAIAGGTINSGLPADVGWVRVKIGATLGRIPVYNNS